MRTLLLISTVFVLASLAPQAAALSHAQEEDGVVTWTFVSPLAQPLDEGIQLTCRTTVDLRTDPWGDADTLNENIVVSCDEALGIACDNPTWAPLKDPSSCWDAAEVSGCTGIFYGFTGTLRIVPFTGGFEVTYDGTYGGWDGAC